MESPEASVHPDPFTGALARWQTQTSPLAGILLIALLVLRVVPLVAHKPRPNLTRARSISRRRNHQGGHRPRGRHRRPRRRPRHRYPHLYCQHLQPGHGKGHRGQLPRRPNGPQRPVADRDRSSALRSSAQTGEGTLEHDQGLLKQAEIDLARYQKASALNAIARQTLEDQEQIVEQYKGTVKNDQGQVDYQRVQLSYCHLTAPASGRVGLRLVIRQHHLRRQLDALVVVTQLQPITVVFNVAEDNLAQLRSQILHRTDLPVDAFDRSQLNKIATGRLLTIDNQVDTTTGTIRFRAQFDNHDLALYPNQFVNARLLVSTLRNTMLIPSAAVQRNGVQRLSTRSATTLPPSRTLSSRPPMATSPRSKASTQATLFRSPASTNCRMAPRWISRSLRKQR